MIFFLSFNFFQIFLTSLSLNFRTFVFVFMVSTSGLENYSETRSKYDSNVKLFLQSSLLTVRLQDPLGIQQPLCKS